MAGPPHPRPQLPEIHGGNREAMARQLGCRPSALVDASASLVPFALPAGLRLALLTAPLRPYPDREHSALRQRIGALHGLDGRAGKPPPPG